MAFLEKANWVTLAVTLVTLAIYFALIVPRALATPIARVAYEETMIWTIVGFIVANILGMIGAAITNPREADKKDQRDKEIDRFGERVGNSIIIAGSCAALVMALTKQDYFWIANSVFVAGLAAALLSAVTKIAAYHGPFQKW